ncbi:putative ribonuclease H-like domain-containing protein [Tanacetum coccineum]
MHVRFLEDKPIIAGDGPKWLFDIDVLTKSINYVPVVAGTNSNDFIGTKESIGAGHSSKESGSSQDYILMPLWKGGSPFDSSSKDASNDEPQLSNDAGKKDDEGGIDDQERTKNSAQDVNTAGPSINTVSLTVPTAPLESTYAYFFGDESELDLSNIATTYPVLTTPNTRIHKDHSLDHVLGDVQSGVQTRRMINEQGFISVVYEGKTHEDLHTCLFACFLSQEEPKKIYLMARGPLEQNGCTKNKKDERVARIEAIRLFLAYASFKDFGMYQMDVKSAFLYGKLEEEVYVYQPLGFEDLEFPDKVYKVEKALYGLHQALRAWYETLSTYLLDNGFQRGLQVTQKDDGIFISQDKYVDEILKKFGFSTVKTTSTPMETSKPLLKDAEAEDVDVHLYRSMIGSLMYLIASRPNIMFVDSPFDLEAYTDSDYAGASLDRKSTTGGCQFLRRRLISWQCKKQTIVANSTTEAEYVAAASCCGQVLWIQNQMLDYGYNFMNTKIHIDNESTICIVKNPVFHSKTKHIEIRHHFIRDSNEKKLIQMIKIHTDHNVADLLTKAFDVGRFQYLIATANDEIQVSTVGLPYYWYALTKNPTIYASLNKKFWQTATVRTVDNREQEITATVDGKEFTITEASVRRHLQLTDVDSISFLPTTKIFDQLSLMGYVLTDDKLTFQKERRKDFSRKVAPLFQTMMVQAPEELGEGLEMPIDPQHTLIQPSTSQPQKKQPRRKQRKDTEEDASKQGRKIADLDADAEVTLVDEAQGRNDDNLMFDTGVLYEQEVEVEKTLIEIKAAKPKDVTTAVMRPKARGVVVQDPNQILIDKEIAQKLQAQLNVELEEEEKLAKQREEDANIAEWDNVQAMIDADYELAARLHAQEQEELTVEEKLKLFVELMDKRKKHFWVEREYKGERLKDSVTEQKEKEAEMKKHMEIVVDEEEIAVDAIPLATKPLIIFDWKIIKEGKMGYFQLIRADRSSRRYSSMIKMLQNIDREDLETLWKLVKGKHGNTRPEEAYERVLWDDLKVMFEPDVESEVWRNLQGYNVTVWKLFSSSGVHFVRFQNLHIFMLVEKKYPLTPVTITKMLNKKLQTDHWNEMCYQLLKLMTKQLKNPGSV